MHLLFVLLVLLGFIFKLLATFPVNYAERIAWGCWLAAAVIWAVPALGGA
jgi:hypothetical protein